MADRRGGPRDSDYRTRQPSATGGARTDMQDTQPARVPAHSTTYGERKELIAAQQAVPLPRESNQPPTGGSPSRSRGGGRGLVKMLGKHGSLKPEEPISAGRDKFTRDPTTLTAREAAFLLEEAVRDMPSVSAGTLSMLNELQRAALTDNSGIAMERSPHPGELP